MHAQIQCIQPGQKPSTGYPASFATVFVSQTCKAFMGKNKKNPMNVPKGVPAALSFKHNRGQVAVAFLQTIHRLNCLHKCLGVRCMMIIHCILNKASPVSTTGPHWSKQKRQIRMPPYPPLGPTEKANSHAPIIINIMRRP